MVMDCSCLVIRKLSERKFPVRCGILKRRTVDFAALINRRESSLRTDILPKHEITVRASYMTVGILVLLRVLATLVGYPTQSF